MTGDLAALERELPDLGARGRALLEAAEKSAPELGPVGRNYRADVFRREGFSHFPEAIEIELGHRCRD
ncbi:hypothetical protein [Alteraurantiacibacter buctensis]|uniref:Uncharacterized protein n=1 Tax=Alteraurantiacibacter buctensis TaxID=1503981 RepID=A0A844YV74_9SPHN|nr:hypothetical protein [Alteraurantiacibacter buctensis]MXO70936.1 hypothetical protein [Alteraurantiacibacter buctensis]